MSELKVNLFRIQTFSTKILTIRKILKDKLKHNLLNIERKYNLLIESYNYINLLKKVAKENNLTINKNAEYFSEIILDKYNNLNSTITDLSKTLSIIHSSLFNSIKIQGMDSSTICRIMSEKNEEFHRGFVLKKYNHDKGYRYLKYIKIYNIHGINIKLDISTDKVKIIDIDNFYYQEGFNTIVIIGKQLTYGEQINCDYVIKVFTLTYLLKTWFDLCETKTNSLRKTWKYKLSFNEIVELDTIVVSDLKELKDVKNINISIDEDGICIKEKNLYSSNPVKLYIKYYSDSRVVENKTIPFIVNPTYFLETIDLDLEEKIENSLLFRINKFGFNETSYIEHLITKREINKLGKIINDIEYKINKIEEDKKHSSVFSFCKSILDIYNSYINPDIDYSKYIPPLLKEKKFIDTRPLGLTNNNYNRNFIPFN